MTMYLMEDSQWLADNWLSIDWVYDDLNDAHEHDLMHIVYSSIDYINEGDYE